MIRVLIRAASPAVRAGLESLLRGHTQFEVLGEPDDEGPSGSVSLDHADVVLAEAEGPEDRSVSESLDAAGEGVPVVLLVHGSAADWLDAWREGVNGILPSNATAEQIAAAITAAAAGLAVFESSNLGQILALPRANGPSGQLPEALTAREIEVLRLMAEGLANKQIAERLAISDHTVKFHVASVMGNLGAASRTEAVTIGIRHGLVLL